MGGILVAGAPGSSGKTISLTKNVIAGNKEFGLSIVNCAETVSVETCHFSGNFGYGVKIASIALPRQLQSGRVRIRKCQVKSNKSAGLFVSDVFTALEDCIIEENADGQVVTRDRTLLAIEKPDAVDVRVSQVEDEAGEGSSECSLQ